MENEHTYFRQCHVCGYVTEGKEEVQRCMRCKKGFLPLKYFERLYSNIQKNSKEGTPQLKVTFNPLPGLLVFW